MRRGYEAFARGDLEAAMELFHPTYSSREEALEALGLSEQDARANS